MSGCLLPLLFSEERFPVTGFDVEQRRSTLSPKAVPHRHIEAAKFGLRKNTDLMRLPLFRISDMDAIISASNSARQFRQPDMSCVGPLRNRSPHIYRPGQLVILESTTYPGRQKKSSYPFSRRISWH